MSAHYRLFRILATQELSSEKAERLTRGVVKNGGARALRALEIFSLETPDDGSGYRGLCEILITEYADEDEMANLRQLVALMDSDGLLEESYAPLHALQSDPTLRPVFDAWKRLPSQFRIEADGIGDACLVWPTCKYGVAGYFRTAQFVPDMLRHYLAKTDCFLGREYHYVSYTDGESAGLPHPRTTRLDQDSGIIQLPVPQLPSSRVSQARILLLDTESRLTRFNSQMSE